MKYLRDPTRFVPPSDKDKLRTLCEEANYYCMPQPFVDLVSYESTQDFPGPKVDEPDGATLSQRKPDQSVSINRPTLTHIHYHHVLQLPENSVGSGGVLAPDKKSWKFGKDRFHFQPTVVVVKLEQPLRSESGTVNISGSQAASGLAIELLSIKYKLDGSSDPYGSRLFSYLTVLIQRVFTLADLTVTSTQGSLVDVDVFGKMKTLRVPAKSRS